MSWPTSEFAMEQARTSLTVRAERQGLVEITGEVAAWLAGQTVGDGLLTVFIRHTWPLS